jgi:phage terminase Nu1 subunit (DNA packaging protein)
MSTQPSYSPTISLHFEPYVDSKRAAAFLAVGWKRLQKLSREGKIPAHPVLSGPRNRRRTWRYKLSELDEWARDQGNSVAAGCATSPKEK